MEDHSKKAIIAALLGNLMICISKFIVAILSGSIAMLAEAFHSLADTGNQILLLVGRRLARRPADDLHPFGYGRERYFWPFVVAVSMFTVGAAVSINQGIGRIRSPHEISGLTATYVVLGLSMVFELFSWMVAFKGLRKEFKGESILRVIKHTKAPALIIVFLEDSAAMLGLIIAFVGILIAHYTGDSRFDGIASIIIGVILAFVAFVISYEIKSLLIGEGVSKKDYCKLHQAILAQPVVVAVVELLTMYLSPDEILVNCRINLVDCLETDGVEEALDKLENVIRENLPKAGRVFLEADSGLEVTNRQD